MVAGPPAFPSRPSGLFPWEVTERVAASMLLVDERFPWRAAAAEVEEEEERLGLGRLRYCSVERALMGRKLSSWWWWWGWWRWGPPSEEEEPPPSFNPPTKGRCPDLGSFPRVAEPLVMVAPLAVTIVTRPCFLKPKVVVVAVLPLLAGRIVGSFLASSPLLLRPASDGERWRPLRPFSDTLTSSVLPEASKKKALQMYCRAGGSVAKNAGLGGVWGGHGGGLAVGLEEVLEDHLAPQEGKAVLQKHCLQCG